MDLDLRASRSARWIGLFLLFVLLLQPSLARADELGSEMPAPTASLSAPLLAGGWKWRNLFLPVESALGNRRRMIQFATIGMCIGLYILMRK